ncbi:hypothetical protein M427DRAFT_69080 [Gonapodya prolifera JEL478]|uniref:Uncharacterized protein n=1 Tax=Gonapodya prolifera (strain JEL478) TaxID=1344416 RepID=A0A139AI95_GONPJ|nr:hypothetical protein M427DRAFT_69080 [Gonapodya prolifera JEL478]|eukprot:KXS16510.1 hypothetical protein M427DRAFT_69080 [Gonapodya prolifera JEL478]
MPASQDREKAMQLDEDLHDLKLRFELLEGDRKAYYETSQWAIRQNKEEMAHLRSQNKELRDMISKLKKAEGDASTSRTMSDVEKLDQKVCELRNKHDLMEAEVRAREAKLKELQDRVAHLQPPTGSAGSSGSRVLEPAHLKEIHALENRLDKALIKYNEAQAVRKMYEAIVKKLQDERLTFDSKLTKLEKLLQQKKQEAAELEAMSRDANHAKEVAKADLLRFELQLTEDRKQREKDLHARKELVKQRLEMNEKMEKRGTPQTGKDGTAPLSPTAGSGPNASQCDDSRTAGSSGALDTSTGGAGGAGDDPSKAQHFAGVEETLRVLRDAVGVLTVPEISAKLVAQRDTNAHLVSLQASTSARLEELRARKQRVLQEYEELKFTGRQKSSAGKGLEEEFKTRVEEAKKEVEEVREKWERVGRIVKEARAGVGHLAEKLEGVQLDRPTEVPAGADPHVHTLDVCIEKMDKLYHTVKGKENLIETTFSPSPAQPTPGGAAGGASAEPTLNLLTVTQAGLPAHNTRVRMGRKEFEEEGGGENDPDTPDADIEVPDRESIKRASMQVVNARKGKGGAGGGKKKGRRGKGGGGDDDDE